jgi:hypothetical protein
VVGLPPDASLPPSAVLAPSPPAAGEPAFEEPPLVEPALVEPDVPWPPAAFPPLPALEVPAVEEPPRPEASSLSSASPPQLAANESAKSTARQRPAVTRSMPSILRVRARSVKFDLREPPYRKDQGLAKERRERKLLADVARTSHDFALLRGPTAAANERAISLSTPGKRQAPGQTCPREPFGQHCGCKSLGSNLGAFANESSGRFELCRS